MGCTDRDSNFKAYRFDTITQKWGCGHGFVATFEEPTKIMTENEMKKYGLDIHDFDFAQLSSDSWKATPRLKVSA